MSSLLNKVCNSGTVSRERSRPFQKLRRVKWLFQKVWLTSWCIADCLKSAINCYRGCGLIRFLPFKNRGKWPWANRHTRSDSHDNSWFLRKGLHALFPPQLGEPWTVLHHRCLCGSNIRGICPSFNWKASCCCLRYSRGRCKSWRAVYKLLLVRTFAPDSRRDVKKNVKKRKKSGRNVISRPGFPGKKKCSGILFALFLVCSRLSIKPNETFQNRTSSMFLSLCVCFPHRSQKARLSFLSFFRNVLTRGEGWRHTWTRGPSRFA